MLLRHCCWCGRGLRPHLAIDVMRSNSSNNNNNNNNNKLLCVHIMAFQVVRVQKKTYVRYRVLAISIHESQIIVHI